jgi:YD repeat-containing protein
MYFSCVQTRTHNAANEITDVTETGGQVAWATPVQDVMGNVTSYPKPSSLTNSYAARYDAWNRLGWIRDGGNFVATYVYDGLGRRITGGRDASRSESEPAGQSARADAAPVSARCRRR